MRTIGGEPKLIWSCEPAAIYPFRVARSIAGDYAVEVGRRQMSAQKDTLTSLLRRAKCLLIIFRA